jgi:hypothetical protein
LLKGGLLLADAVHGAAVAEDDDLGERVEALGRVLDKNADRVVRERIEVLAGVVATDRTASVRTNSPAGRPPTTRRRQRPTPSTCPPTHPRVIARVQLDHSRRYETERHDTSPCRLDT